MAKGGLRTSELFEKALASEGIQGPLADIARSIYTQESGGGRNTKTSNAGAVGGMQIIPGTFAQMADRGWDINNPEHNARAGIRYLKQLHHQAGGDPMLTAAGYYGGPGGLEKARRGVAVSDPRNPLAPDTLRYGREVASRLPQGQPLGVREETPAPQREVPIQVAQAPVREVVSPPPEETWEQFQKQLPPEAPVQVADLDYGQQFGKVTIPAFELPVSAAPKVNLRPFQRMKAWV